MNLGFEARSARTSTSGALAGRVIAITGAGRGIGAATATALTAEGARVAIGDIDLDIAKATAERIGGDTIALPLDVTSVDSVRDFMDTVESTLGPIDVYINNAGVMPLSPLLDEDDAVIDRIFAINTRAMIHSTREAARRMLPRGKGHIVNVASTAGKAGIAGSATYSASKAAVIQYTEGAYAELHDSGLEFTVVMPGITRTELTDGVEDMPAFRAITPESVADAITAAIIKPRFEVYVPGSARPLMNVTRLLPFSVGQWIGKKMGADHVFMDALKRPERSDYEARAKGAEQ
ncbi:SDR family oxidoreductase [Nocardioides humilatus]|uniref:SDR family oxidoreductase n=1 Tax=Nocardioides humilatus TaxID=2607660 RepID=A0A5B1LG17_9ACTN|nr:SDR family oxidoreductase [Nocardioides humilatus]KAA1419294.1 SDR family oxidoreductase [Nocardioides humilatus]